MGIILEALMRSVVFPHKVIPPLPVQSPQIEQSKCCTNEEAHADKGQCT